MHIVLRVDLLTDMNPCTMQGKPQSVHQLILPVKVIQLEATGDRRARGASELTSPVPGNLLAPTLHCIRMCLPRSNVIHFHGYIYFTGAVFKIRSIF